MTKSPTEAHGLAQKIVHGIVRDICGRMGWGKSWDAIDEDRRAEIIQTWERIVELEVDHAARELFAAWVDVGENGAA